MGSFRSLVSFMNLFHNIGPAIQGVWPMPERGPKPLLPLASHDGDVRFRDIRGRQTPFYYCLGEQALEAARFSG